MAFVQLEAELVPCSEGESDQAQLPPNNNNRSRWALTAAAAVFVLAVAVLTWPSSDAGAAKLAAATSVGQLQGKAWKGSTWESPFPTQCGTMNIDMDSDDDSGWGVGFDHIPNPEVCCAMCQGVPECKSFTWVKDAGLDGCPSQCWLKGGEGVQKPNTGFVSGSPPQRKQLGSIPAPSAGEGTSMFCFSLMVPHTDEQKLLKWQSENKASIFACDDFSVFSNMSLEVAPGVTTSVIDSDLKCGFGGDSGTALNAWIFIALFHKLLDDGKWATNDWTVKADPDAVFFADRLVAVVREHQGAAYLNNCKYGMHGPIEVFGKPAMAALNADYKSSFDGKAPKTCVEKMDFGLWGEDMFLDQCLKLLKVGAPPLDTRLMCEDHCECPAWYWCNNGTDRVSFHPFKTVESYSNCMANAGITL